MERLETIHHIKGYRCRLRLRNSDLTPRVAVSLRQQLSVLKSAGAIADFAVNERTRSLVLVYDGEEALARALAVVIASLPPSPSPGSAISIDARKPASARVANPNPARASNGTDDIIVNFVVPVGLELVTGTWWVPLGWTILTAVAEGDKRRGTAKVSKAVASMLLERTVKGAVKGAICKFS